MSFADQLNAVLEKHRDIRDNPDRESVIKDAVDRREAIVTVSGALATWTPPESTGRSPQDTYIVRRKESEDTIDWDSPNNIPLAPESFDMILEDVLNTLPKKDRIYIIDRVVGAETAWALPIRAVTDFALSALFADNMFRPVPKDLDKSVFAKRPFTLVSLPYNKLDPDRYEGRLRKLPSGETSNMAVAMDFDRRLGIVFGSAYCGSMKKLIFTVMNYMLPGEGILPLHCSANEGPDGDIALLLGLSGTGKTSLSADPRRALLGDDEHGWSEHGIANFEYGCYAKMININPKKEPEIYNAVMHQDDFLQHGAIVENAMMYPDGSFDYDDERLTPNSRASYPLRYLTNVKESSKGADPETILFLAADANGVLPPVARLTKEQAMLWFLMGYTSKLAGTETGIVDPKSTFSRFFGQPFMPRNPHVYARMLGEKLNLYETTVYLINTGWSGGPYGIGERIDIDLTRAMVHAAVSGELADVEYWEDPVFHVHVPSTCPGISNPEMLNPKNTWNDKAEYDRRAAKLAGEFQAYFEKAYGDKGIDAEVAAQCPGA